MPALADLWPAIVTGLAFGAMYAVTGTGLVVLYRTTGVVNLAFGAVGCMGAHLAWSWLGGSISNPNPVGHGWKILAYPGLVAICALIMWLYGVIVAPRLARRDPLVKALGMLGLALILLGIMKQKWDTSKPRQLLFPRKVFKLWGATITTTQILALVLAVVVVALVTLYLQKSSTGTAMRAISDNRDSSALLGVPVRRVESLAWAGSGVITGLVFMILPALSDSLDQTTLTWFVVGALAGAIVGQFKSLWVTLIASLLIGVGRSVLFKFNGSLGFIHDFYETTPYVVSVLAILWISRKRTVVLAGREMR